MADPQQRSNLKVGVKPVEVEVVSEPYVVMSFRGYAPVMDVQGPDGKQILFISSKSISEGLEPLRQANGGKFIGLKLRLRKETEDRMAPYIVEKV
jgi:hypothetical protein